MAKNVVFVSFDDLFNVVRFRDVYGEPLRTPNIDRLLAMGTYFDAAHAVVPVCNPSRVATLTGQSPFRTGIENNEQNYFDLVDPSTTLPYLFREAGYTTAAVGKIFHGNVERQHLNSERGIYLRELFDFLQPSEGRIRDASTRMPDSEFPDFKAAAWASDFIRSEHDQPWFLALGFMKPHLNWVVPARYYELYDRSKITVPENPTGDFRDVPLFFQQFFEPWQHERVLRTDTWEKKIVAYMASVSFADAQLGTVLDAMDRTDAWDDTTLVVWSDHGFHLGDKQHWGKSTHWEQGTNAPLIIVDPDVGRPGTVVRKPVSLLDIFPTLVDLTGIDDPLPRDGHSLVPLLRDPGSDWHHFAGSFFAGSISLRTERFRYIASIDGSEQLYDMVRDPGQFRNLAGDADYRDALSWLHNRMGTEIGRLGGEIDFHARRIVGTAADEQIFVSPNLRVAAGGDGDDVYVAIETDAIEEARGGGFDTLMLFAAHDGVTVDVRVPRFVEQTVLFIDASGHVQGSRRGDEIRGSRRDDRLDGGQGDDRLFGGGGDDLLKGGRGNDRLVGDADRDPIHRSSGDDHLQGGGGRDLLVGGPGQDRLSGDRGEDTFKFRSGAGVDRIVDFTPGKDLVDLTSLDLRGFDAVRQETTEQGWAVARIADSGVTIVFRGLTWSDLGAEDFLY